MFTAVRSATSFVRRSDDNGLSWLLRVVKAFTALCIAIFCAIPDHSQTGLLVNGGFENGDFAGWNRFAQAGSPGEFQIATGNVSPSEGFPTAGPSSGVFYAITDSNAPGTDDPGAYALIQTFTVPLFTKSVTLSYSLFVNDWFGEGPLNQSGLLDYTQSDPTQFARVDLLTSSAMPFTTANGSVVQQFFQGTFGEDPAYSYNFFTYDLTGLVTPGQTYQLRFASVQNQFSINVGVDDVSVIAQVAAPEPSTIALLIFALVALPQLRRRFGQS